MERGNYEVVLLEDEETGTLRVGGRMTGEVDVERRRKESVPTEEG